MDEKRKKGIDKTVEIRYNSGRARRGVAQFGRVLGLGPRCRRFKSCRLDHAEQSLLCSVFLVKKTSARFPAALYNFKVSEKRKTLQDFNV